jgi:hypothetical protein
MTVTLTPHAEALLSQLADAGSPEELVERGLEQLAENRSSRRKSGMTPAEAVDRILQLRERNTLGGISVKELINEGRKY